jgi:hypothetical protein
VVFGVVKSFLETDIMQKDGITRPLVLGAKQDAPSM